MFDWISSRFLQASIFCFYLNTLYMHDDIYACKMLQAQTDLFRMLFM
jgi:hypothetical protein